MDTTLRGGGAPWENFHQAEIDLFASLERIHCPLCFSLTQPAPLGLDVMVQTWQRLSPYISLLGVLERLPLKWNVSVPYVTLVP